MTDIAELNTGSEYNNTLKTLRECGGVDEWVALDEPEHSPHTRELLVKLARGAIGAAGFIDQYCFVDRIPRLSNGDRENDVEHSFSLAIIATNLAQKLRPDLDVNRIRQFSLVHDMLETKTGDVATFSTSPEEQAEKERREKEALDELLWPNYHHSKPRLSENTKNKTPQRHAGLAMWTKWLPSWLTLLARVFGSLRKILVLQALNSCAMNATD